MPKKPHIKCKISSHICMHCEHASTAARIGALQHASGQKHVCFHVTHDLRTERHSWRLGFIFASNKTLQVCEVIKSHMHAKVSTCECVVVACLPGGGKVSVRIYVT